MLLNLSDLSSEPLYGQILRQIRALILNGDLPKEQAIPSIRDLARAHKVSPITVQKAYEELAREGLVVSRRGKGYFVADLAFDDRDRMARLNCKESLIKPIEAALTDGLTENVIQEIVAEIFREQQTAKH